MSGGDQFVLWSLLVAATVTDLCWGKIYNFLTLPLVFVGICYHYWSGGPSIGSQSIAAVATAFVFFFPLYLVRVFAAGDVKLLMAIGAWTNPALVIRIGVLAIVIGSVVGVYLLFRAKGLKGSLNSLGTHFKALKKEVKAKPYRMPLAPAFLCALLLIQIADKNQWGLF